jgi:hypothetical protein
MPSRPKEYDKFMEITDKLLAVSRSELQKRLDAYKEKAAKNPRKRGPKPKNG